MSIGFEQLVGSGISEALACRLTDVNPIQLLTRGLVPHASALAA